MTLTNEAAAIPSLQRRLSIVFVVPRFHTNLYFAVKALVDAGHFVHLICAARETIEDHSVVKPIYLGESPSFNVVMKTLSRLAPDLLFIRDVKHLSKRFFLIGAFRCDRLFGYDQRPFYRRRSTLKIVLDLLRGRPVRRMTPVLGLDRSGPPDPHAVYIPFPVERDPGVEERVYAPSGVVRFLCVGKLAQPRKNHRLLIEALAGLKNRGAFTLTLVGSSNVDVGGGSNEYLQALYWEAQNGALADRMTIQPDVPFHKISSIYNEHDVCVLPSVREPLGTAPLEGMAYGCVPVFSTECGTAAYIPNENYGYVVKGGDIEALRAALRPMIAEPARIAEIGRNAQALVETEFCAARFVKRIEALVNAS